MHLTTYVLPERSARCSLRAFRRHGRSASLEQALLMSRHISRPLPLRSEYDVHLNPEFGIICFFYA